MSFTESFEFLRNETTSKTNKITIREEVFSVREYGTGEAFTVDYGYDDGDIPNQKVYEYELLTGDHEDRVFAGWYNSNNGVLWIYTKNQILYTENEVIGMGFRSFGGTSDGVGWDYGRGTGMTFTHNYSGWYGVEDVYGTGYSFYNAGAQLEVSANIPIFANQSDAILVAKGKLPVNEPINGGNEEESDGGKYPYRKYYFYNKTFELDGTLTRSLNGEYLGSGKLCGYLTLTEPYNVKLISNGELHERLNDEEEYHDITTLPKLTSNTTLNSYYGLLDTNIPIFKNAIDAGGYLLTGNFDNAINAADCEEDSKTGKDGTVARFDRANTYTMIPRGQLVYDVTSNINDIYTWMRSLNQINITQLMFMYWWNNNPIECLTSLYWTPLDVDELTRASAPAPVIFGGYAAGMDPEHPLDESSWIKDPVLQYQGKEMLLGQFQFSRKYNDWRDYECFSYSLYLPFYGIVELAPHFIVGKRLEVKYIYYPTNHTIHYMIFVKKNIYKEFDCSVGIDLAMTSADAAGKSQEVFSDIFSMGGSAVSEAGSLASGNVTGAISSASSLISSGIDLFKKPKVVTWGNVNPTSNIGDPLQALLFIEEQKCVVPNKLHEMYGYATYYIGKVSGVSGYCEFSDVRIESSATPEEKNQIISMMQQGVII